VVCLVVFFIAYPSPVLQLLVPGFAAVNVVIVAAVAAVGLCVLLIVRRSSLTAARAPAYDILP